MERINITNEIYLIKYEGQNNNNLIDYNEFIYQTKKTVYKKYVEYYWGEWDENAQRNMFNDFMNSVKNNIWIIKYKNENIGFYNGENIDDKNYEIGNICIISDYQGKGVGTKILKKVLELHNKQNIHLQYFKNNPVGELYIKLGFVFYKEKEFHYVMIKNNLE